MENSIVNAFGLLLTFGIYKNNHKGPFKTIYSSSIARGVEAQSVERATRGEEVMDSRCDRTLPTGWVGVSIM